MGEFQVCRDDSVTLRQHCEDYHYLHRWPDDRSLPFGYRLISDGVGTAPDGRLHGLVVMKKPQHHRQVGLFGYEGLPTSWQVLDLARVWINPCWQVPGLNIFSRMVGMVMRQVQSDWLEHHPPVFPDLPYHIRLIISYCELSHHDGTAYRACSFARHGLTSDGSKELYIRHLRQPLKAWHPTRETQFPLLEGLPLVHSKVKYAN
jgi:hypothetical protein